MFYKNENFPKRIFSLKFSRRKIQKEKCYSKKTEKKNCYSKNNKKKQTTTSKDKFPSFLSVFRNPFRFLLFLFPSTKCYFQHHNFSLFSEMKFFFIFLRFFRKKRKNTFLSNFFSFFLFFFWIFNFFSFSFFKKTRKNGEKNRRKNTDKMVNAKYKTGKFCD